MRRISFLLAICAGWAAAAACDAADDRVDPRDLELRDLLGLAPSVASEWDGAQRAAAREVLAGGLAIADERTALPAARSGVAGALAASDRARAAAGEDALGLVRVSAEGAAIAVVATDAVALLADADAVREPDVVAALVHDAAGGDDVVVEPVTRLAVVSAYVDGAPPRLLINPVLLAALEPDGDGVVAAAGDVLGAGRSARVTEGVRAATPGGPAVSAATGGNPYSFYGSVAECAAAQLRRCDACLPSSSCEPVTDTTDGDGECTMLAAAGGRGAFLLCANLALSISSVGHCVKGEAPSCPFTTDAARSLATLEENARFVDDAACGGGLDRCLADIYGAPSGSFPGVDGGTGGDPPRDTSVSCGNSCDDSNANCEPSCGSCEGSGPSCDNSLSCGSGCSGSNDQSGCGGCDSDGSSSGGGGSCSGCSGDSGGSSGGGGCSGCSDSGGSSGGGCGGGDSGGGGSCGSCNDSGGSSSGGSCSGGDSGGGGDCGGGSCGGSGGGGGCGGGGGGGGDCGSCNSGGGGGSCNVARREPSAGLGLAIAALWALLPVPAAALLRRRRRGDENSDADPDRTADPDDAATARTDARREVGETAAGGDEVEP